MKFLFIHQNFPGQYRHVARALADDPAHEVVAVGETRFVRQQGVLHPRIRLETYEPHGTAGKETHHYLRDFEGHVRRGQSVARGLIKLREGGFQPDVIAAHPGWGEALFVRDVFPHGRHVHYFEYYYHGRGGDLGFDKEFPSSFDDELRVRIRNSTQLHALVTCDAGLSPTHWQRSRYPAEFQSKIAAIHDGIDTRLVAPDPTASIAFDGERYAAGEEILTYVARNLEPYRGFHTFMRALPAILRERPSARVLVVGGDDVSYGRRLPEGETYRALYTAEVKDAVDWSRVRFTGRLSYTDYLKVLQVSRLHLYLTYPFVLSWSMMEAMSAGCLMLASDTAPVQEVMTHGLDGWLTSFFDAEALASQASAMLARPEEYAALRAAARRKVVENYDLTTRCLPATLAWLVGS